ncbi:MAG: DUF5723 family protein [Ekhidna sp.]
MRKITATILFLASLLSLNAQTSLSFQHLGNATFQNNLINPSLIPEGKFFLGLPVLSGVHANVNNKFSYNEGFTVESTRTLIDVPKIIGNLQGQNMVSTKVGVNLLHLGYKLKSGVLLSFVANERVEADFLYSKELVQYVFTDGNSAFLNQDIKISRIGLTASHFREFGLGIAAPVNDQLTVGLRGKFLVGFGNASLPGNTTATLNSNGEAFQIDAEWKNATLRTSGFDIYDETVGDINSHLVMNGNTGFALDIGGTYELNRYYTITGSLVDVGFINWKENIKSYTLADTTFNYSGVDLENLDDIEQTLEDSLFSKFETTDTFDPYKSWLPATAYGSWIYHYSPKTDIYVTVGSRWVQRQFKMMYGGGITQKFGKAFTGSISVTKLPQQFFNVGAAIAVKGGPVQMYMAADQVINFSVPDAKAFDFRFGMSFAFGNNKEKEDKSSLTRSTNSGARGLDTNVFLGKKVKTKKRDGIYSIIKRQKKRDVKNKRSKREGDVQKKSLNGRSGKKNANGTE